MLGQRLQRQQMPLALKKRKLTGQGQKPKGLKKELAPRTQTPKGSVVFWRLVVVQRGCRHKKVVWKG